MTYGRGVGILTVDEPTTEAERELLDSLIDGLGSAMHHGAPTDEHDGVLSSAQPDDDALYAHAAEDITSEREILNSSIDGLAEAMHHGARADEHDGVLSMTQPDDDALFAHAAEKMTGDRELLNSLIDGLAEAMHHCAPTDENDGVLSMTQPDDDVLFADAGEAITCQRDMLDSLLDGLEDAMGHASFINERSNEHADASAHSATTIESRDQALLDRMVDDLVAAVAESETVHVDDVVETCGEMIDGGFAPHADDFIAAATPAAQAADMQRAVEGLLSSAQSPATPADDSAEVQSFDPLELNTLE